EAARRSGLPEQPRTARAARRTGRRAPVSARAPPPMDPAQRRRAQASLRWIRRRASAGDRRSRSSTFIRGGSRDDGAGEHSELGSGAAVGSAGAAAYGSGGAAYGTKSAGFGAGAAAYGSGAAPSSASKPPLDSAPSERRRSQITKLNVHPRRKPR